MSMLMCRTFSFVVLRCVVANKCVEVIPDNLRIRDSPDISPLDNSLLLYLDEIASQKCREAIDRELPIRRIVFWSQNRRQYVSTSRERRLADEELRSRISVNSMSLEMRNARTVSRWMSMLTCRTFLFVVRRCVVADKTVRLFLTACTSQIIPTPRFPRLLSPRHLPARFSTSSHPRNTARRRIESWRIWESFLNSNRLTRYIDAP